MLACVDVYIPSNERGRTLFLFSCWVGEELDRWSFAGSRFWLVVDSVLRGLVVRVCSRIEFRAYVYSCIVSNVGLRFRLDVLVRERCSIVCVGVDT